MDTTTTRQKPHAKQTIREFWRDYRSSPDAEEIPEPLTSAQIADATDAINFTLVVFGAPDKNRAYVDALIGASYGSMDWIEAADIEVGQRARQVSAEGLKQKTVEKWTQRQRDEFSEWQRMYGVTLIESMPGGKSEGQNYKTRYRLKNLFEIALEIEARARMTPGFEKKPQRARRKAAAAVYQEFKTRLTDPPERRRFRRPRQTCDTYAKLVNTYVEKLCGQALLEHKDLGTLLLPILLKILGKDELLINSLAHFSNGTQSQQTQEVNPSVWVDNFVHPKNGAESAFVHIGNQSGMDSPIRGCDSPRECVTSPEESHPLEPLMLDECRAVETCRSVGCRQFEWFFVDPETDKKVGGYNPVTADELAATISDLVEDARHLGYSLVIRVRGPVLQLDDCDAAAALLLEPFSFLVIETSEDNFQVWLAFSDDWDKSDARDRLFAQLKEIAPGVNPGAGGATRWPGSINQKPSRNGFRVRIDSVNPGRIVTPSELEAAGLLADQPAQVEYDWQTAGAPGAWPDYARNLEANTNEDGKTDRSGADWDFSCYALKRRWSPKDVCQKLLELSSKAKEKGEPYVNRTVARAAAHLGLGGLQ